MAKAWSREDEKTLVKLVRAGEPTSKIARALKRTPASVRSKAQKQSLSLRGASVAAKRSVAKKAVAKKSAAKRSRTQTGR